MSPKNAALVDLVDRRLCANVASAAATVAPLFDRPEPAPVWMIPDDELERLLDAAGGDARFVELYDRVVRWYWSRSEAAALPFETFRGMVEASGLAYPALDRSAAFPAAESRDSPEAGSGAAG